MSKNELSDSDLKKKLQDYLKRFQWRDRANVIGDDDSFLDSGFIDSTGVLELVNFLEETFGITIEDEELLPDNLDSLNKLIAFVKKKKEHAA